MTELMEKAAQAFQDRVIDILTSMNSLDELLEQTCLAAQEVTGASFVRLWTMNPSQNRLELAHNVGHFVDTHGPLSNIPNGKWLVGIVAESGQAEFCEAVDSTQGDTDHECFCCMPLISRGSSLGVISIGGFCPDIHQRNRFQRAMNLVAVAIAQRTQEVRWLENEAQLRDVLSVNNVGTLYWDHELQKMRSDSTVNRLLGIEAEIPDWSVILTHIHDLDRELFSVAMEGALLSPRFVNVIFRPRDSSQSERWLELKGTSHFSFSGKLLRFPCAIIDVTDRVLQKRDLQNARRQAEAATKARGEFVANVSHEIRTPLTVILGNVEMLRSCDNLNSRQQLLDSIGQSGQFLLSMVDDILDISKIDAGKLEITRELVLVPQLIEMIVAPFRARCQAKGLELHVIVAAMPSLLVDPLRLRQILFNLLGNAVKFTQIGEVVVDVKYDRNAAVLEISVQDTGVGIPEDKQSLIFQPFVQISTGDSRLFGGSGLGLAISKRLAVAMDGRIQVSSRRDSGSTFCVTIPARPSPEAEEVNRQSSNFESFAEHRDGVVDGTKRLQRRRILAVDDRPDIHAIIQHFLSQAGSSVHSAYSGDEAVNLVQQGLAMQHTWDAVLLDLQMPQKDGWQTAEHLRRLGFTGPIIALTASTADVCQKIDFHRLFSGLVLKPIVPAKLIDLLSTQLESRIP